MNNPSVADIVAQQRAYYQSGETRDLDFRMRQLRKLLDAINNNQTAILEALKNDLNKPPLEAYGAEIGLVREEIRHTLRHLKGWVRPKRMPIHVTQFPSTAWLYPEPYGVTLIIAPWNYPLLLIMAPLVGAIAAGNCAIVKPSEIAPNTSALVTRILRACFEPRYIASLEGGPEMAQALLAEKFDYILFTGSAEIGRLVMLAAARNLTPVTLELGGKCPAIVDADVDIETAARRILWGKFLNAGQICISPDYALVDRRVKDAFVQATRKALLEFYGADPRQSPDYSRIIDNRHYQRLVALLPSDPAQGRVIIGGQTDATERYIAPTVIDNVPADSPLMQSEIFGPLLPIIEYDGLDEAIRFVNERPHPLALYFFSHDKEQQKRILNETTSGGGCINDTILHYTTPLLPFGGVGESGMGKYRGESSFNTFTHHKAFIKKGFRLDFWFRFAPYKNNHKFLKWLM